MQRRTRPGRRRSSPLRWLGWLAALLVVAGIALMLLAPTLVTRLIRSYLARQEFRQKAEVMLSAVTGGEAHLSALTWSDDTVAVRDIQVDNAHGWNIEATGVHAALDFGAIRNGVWNIETVGADELMLRAVPTSTFEKREEAGGVVSATDSLPAFLRSYLPTRVEISGCDVERFSLEQNGWHIAEAHLHAGNWASGRTALPFKLTGGTLQLPMRLPEQPEPLKLTLNKATLRASHGHLQLSDASLGWKESSTATLRGSIEFGTGAWKTTAHVQSVPVAEFLNAWWKQRLSGTAKGDLEFSGGRGSAAAWKAHAVLENGVLQGLPLLETLATYTRVERFKRLVLDTCQASFRPEGEALRIDQIVVQSNGLLRIEGMLTLRGREVEGDFMVGVTPETLRWLPGAQNGVFVLNHASGPPGLHWARVRVGGTLDAPQEDLSPRLLGSAGMALLFESPGQIVNQGAEMLLKPVVGEDAAKVPGKVMEGAGGVLENGVKAGAGLLNQVIPLFPGSK